jgi:hypothetical protein
VLAKIPYVHPVAKIVLDQILRRLREQDLATMPRLADARGAVDIQTGVSASGADRFPRVEAHPDTQRLTMPPGPGRHCALRLYGGVKRMVGAFECNEKSVALGFNLDAAMRGKRRSKDMAVFGEDAGVRGVAHLLDQPRRSLDVREKERDCAGGETRHQPALEAAHKLMPLSVA